jgi:hypothetical protein
MDTLRLAKITQESNSRQPTLPQLTTQSNIQLETRGPYAPQSERSRQIQDACIVLAIGQKLPFSFLRSAEFKFFMNVVDPRCVIPHPIAFKELLSEKCSFYASLREVLARGSMAISFGADGWTEKGVHFLSITMHTISQADEHVAPQYRTEVLPLVHSEGSQDFESTLNQITQVVSNLLANNFSKVGALTTDSASVMLKMGKYLYNQTGIRHVTCAIHRIQTWIDGYIKHANRKPTIMRLQSIVKKTRRSRIVKEAFHKAQEDNGSNKRSVQAIFKRDNLLLIFALFHRNLIQDVSTRWNALFLMCERARQERFNISRMYDSANFSLELPTP